MEYKIDYDYEPSDLNLLQTRTKILTGKYAGTILDFGGSFLGQWTENDVKKNSFSFEYTLFQKPEKFKDVSLRGDIEFENYLANLLVFIVKHKLENPEDVNTITSRNYAAKIKIDRRFHVEKFLRVNRSGSNQK